MGHAGLLRIVCAVGGIVFIADRDAWAADCSDPLGRLVSVEGTVQVQSAGSSSWRPAGLNQPLCPGDAIWVGERSRAAATLENDNKLRIDQNSTLRLIRPDNPERSLIDLWEGAAYFFSRKRQSLDIRTPVVNAAVEGTEFLITIAASQTLVAVVHGGVRASNDRGEIVLGDGEAAVATANTPPTATVLVRPLDAVQWAIYYPSILPFIYDPGARAPAGLSANLTAAIAAASAGRTSDAFALFAAVPEAYRDANFYLYRAAVLLSVGQADEASRDVAAVLADDPKSATAYGLRAVIAIAHNDTTQGLTDANRAVELDPASAPALIAQSYALQAQFNIEGAREAAERATTVAPGNALGWARLAELWLMQGWRDRSREAADHAHQLAPDLERVHTVAGFAALSEFDTTRARQEFERAIEISPANPQPRLGLGLATIRTGSLRQGRRDLETAVLLDPDSALLRSYLGKAFFDEKRNTLASTEFNLAKEIDPNDPTAFFYSAIQKQTENRPVEALRDLEKSIDLNDDRAVYRSRELLDSDRAARGASLGRIYDDLGFQQLGVNAATRSLSFDPSNAAAHRFLSDVYVAEPRHEISRLSEQLQAQLLQDINVNPVQPSLNVTGFNVITTGGPARPGFNEFNPLFERNQAQLNATGLVGNNGTWGNEAVVSGLYDRYSVSVGQFHYQTDGFRDNNDFDTNVYNAYAQAAITPDFNVQGEFNHVSTDNGLLPIYFDPALTLPDERFSTNNTSGRGGLRYSISPNSSIISSFIYSDFDYKDTDNEAGYKATTTQKGYQGETANLYQKGILNATSGGGAFVVNNDLTELPDSESPLSENQFQTTFVTGYSYLNLKVLPNLLGTLGLGVDYFSQQGADFTKVNPKVGLQWEALPNVTVRAAVFRVVKPPVLTNRTIQPTQVAGFNQFFDDPDGTESWRYGAGVDVRITDDVSSGIELSQRRIQENIQPRFTDTAFTNEQRRENYYKAYTYWTPFDELAFSGTLIYDEYTSDDSIDSSVPKKVATASTPLSVRFFHPSGVFSTLTWTYVHQDVQRDNDSGLPEGKSNFNLLDASIGYRLPNRLGIVSLQGTNLLNKNFNYQDDIFRQFTLQQNYSYYIPERGIIGRATLNF